jgi:glutamate dehydrogenase
VRLSALAALVDDLILPETRGAAEGFAQRLLEAGAPRRIVEPLVTLAKLDGAIGVVSLAVRAGQDELALTRAFAVLGAALGLDWAQGAAMKLMPSDPWERLLAAGLARDFQAMRLDFLARGGGDDPEARVAKWLAEHAGAVTRFSQMTIRARASLMPSAAMLAQIAGQARGLLGS